MGAERVGAQAWVMNRMIGQNPTPDDCICTQYRLTGPRRAPPCCSAASALPRGCHRRIPVAQVNLNLESKAAHKRKAVRTKLEGAAPPPADYRRGKSGHAFSADNPYGAKPAGDKRQFVRI